MSHFYASIKGNRGEATRGGSKDSGITGHIRGWDIGVEVDCSHENGQDTCTIRITGGSNDPTRLKTKLLATIYDDGTIQKHKIL